MPITFLKAQPVAEKILEEVKAIAAQFRKETGRAPTLAVVLVGENAPSQVYVRTKSATCLKLGIEPKDFSLPISAGENSLHELIGRLNNDSTIDGILVQCPLPKGWSEQKAQSLVDPKKDVDGFHPLNAGALYLDAKNTLAHGLPPCTPAGVMEILAHYGFSLGGKRAVVMGRSFIVGKPMATMLMAHDATVTVAHSRTEQLESICREADLLVAAIGKPQFVTKNFVKPGAWIIDVGINRLASKKIVGDVDEDSVSSICAALTPVPGGVGPMTIALLMRNTVRAALARTRVQ
jgi:methylenetetrahydrofolate dehydrogenase (NADP+) / methenyltetrahydrofolate cyclohydrolase